MVKGRGSILDCLRIARLIYSWKKALELLLNLMKKDSIILSVSESNNILSVVKLFNIIYVLLAVLTIFLHIDYTGVVVS